MPSVINFDAFLFRLRFKPMQTPQLSSSEDDSDLSSSELQQPHINIHITTPKNVRKSSERLIPDSGKAPHRAPEKMMGKHQAPTLNDANHPERFECQARKPSKPGLVSMPTNAHPPSSLVSQPSKPTLMRRVTSKLNISIPSSKSHTYGLQSQPPPRTSREDTKHPSWLPRSPRVTLPVSPTLPNSFVSKENREAALRERGLLPPCKDLSEQERAADDRLGCAPLPPDAAADGFSEAEQLKEKWLAINRTSDSSASDCGPAAPHLKYVATSAQFMLVSPSPPNISCWHSSPNVDSSCRSCEAKTDVALVGRPSISSTVPPLSISSYLEVLHEDPSEQGPLTPPPPFTSVKPPIIISTPVEDEFPSSPVIVESPVSCSFPSYLAAPGSVSQLDGPASPPEKDRARNVIPPPPASRRRTSDSGDRRRPSMGPTLSKFGTNSLSNLGRSVAGSLRKPSSRTLSTADLPASLNLPSHFVVQAPRTAISPTMHSRGSILLETRDIEDAESRRLSELAFLD